LAPAADDALLRLDLDRLRALAAAAAAAAGSKTLNPWELGVDDAELDATLRGLSVFALVSFAVPGLAAGREAEAAARPAEQRGLCTIVDQLVGLHTIC
jgi:hypothetical protein